MRLVATIFVIQTLIVTDSIGIGQVVLVNSGSQKMVSKDLELELKCAGLRAMNSYRVMLLMAT